MEKKKFNGIKNMLSRDEMKQIKGGSGGQCADGQGGCSVGNACACDSHSGTCHTDSGTNSGCACVCVY